jgi:hypothetical protein
MNRQKQIQIDSLIKANPNVDADLIAMARAEIRLLRKSGFAPSGYSLSGRKAQLPLARQETASPSQRTLSRR